MSKTFFRIRELPLLGTWRDTVQGDTCGSTENSESAMLVAGFSKKGDSH